MLGTQTTAVTQAGAGPEWLQYVAAFAPLSALLAAVIAGWIAWRTLAQRREADRRDQWWQRTQWAIGLAMDPDFSRAVVGLIALKHLAGSDLCTAEDYEMLDKIGGAKIDALTLSEESAERRRLPGQPGHGGPVRDEPRPGGARQVPSARADLIPVDLKSRGERVFAGSPEMAKALEEADRLVSFAAARRSG
ncbi:hypothetical protein ACIP9X_07490 [Arthrobacter sp. NPDC093125]|uniref:hypothetical protein n=1 Tax=Arthrobacter sp. NPDC093125 TaxID=3363944 RepID=UPI003829D4CA